MFAKAKLMLKVSIILFLSVNCVFYFLVFTAQTHSQLGTIPSILNFQEDPNASTVYPRSIKIIYSALLSSLAFWGLFFYEKSCKWVVFLCGASLFWWLLIFLYFDKNAFSILNAWQIRVYFLERFFNLLVILVVLGMQLILFSRGKIPKHFE